MSSQAQSEFSYDIYPGLDAELDAALARNVEAGNAEPGAIATSGLTAVVERTLEEQKPDLGTDPLIANWVYDELEKTEQGLHSWQKYSVNMSAPIPAKLEEFHNPNFGNKIDRFYATKLRLENSNLTTPEEINVGETMQLIAVPWKAFRDNLDHLHEWVNEMRTTQGVSKHPDYFHDSLLDAIKNDTKFYRHTEVRPQPGSPKEYDYTVSMLSAREYLDRRIEEEGPWGLALVQTSEQAGVKDLIGKSPDELSEDPSQGKYLKVAGEKVDDLGVFEWLALSFQYDPSKISGSTDYSWMLANRIEAANGGEARVPYGYWGGYRVASLLNRSGDQNGGIRPRLAVV